MGVRVLVTGAGGDSAQGVIRALRKAPCDYVIASICIGKQSPGLHMSDIRGIAPPIALEREYIEFLIEFVRQHAIDIIIPTIDGELPLICRCRSEIEHRSESKVIIGSSVSVAICVDKLATSQYLSDIAVGQPVTMTVADAAKISDMVKSGSKVIMKPKIGGGSKGIRILDATALKGADWLSGDNIYQHLDEYSKEFTAVIMKDGASVVATTVLE
jgi:carbamoylphosphate synthase large subunit